MSQFASLFSADPAPPADNCHLEQASPYSILLVDDEVNVLKALRRVFHHENYKIYSATGATEALQLLNEHAVEILISDYKMPGMTGAELLLEVKRKYPDTIRIMLTGHADTSAVMAAIQEGAVYKFILKPWNDDDLRVSVGLALEQHELKKKNKSLEKQNKEKTNEISMLSKLAVSNRSQLAILLQKRSLLNEKQLQEIYKHGQQNKEPVLNYILKKGWVQEKRIRKILSKELLIEEVNLEEIKIDPAVLALISRRVCEQQKVLPIDQKQRRLTLVMADPMDTGLVDELQFSLGLDIQVVMADTVAFKKKFAELFADGEMDFKELETLVGGEDPFGGIEVVIEEEDDISIEDLLSATDEPPAIRLLNAIVLESVRLGASDIHIQPRSKHVVVRFRIDGVLQDKIHIPLQMLMPLVSRVKIMAELDIAERRRPQDGRITVKTPLKIIDIRISTLPTINGEKVVMRLLDRNSSVFDLKELGLSELDQIKVSNVVSRPQGIILTTGPTGSGKTTTLYSLLQKYATPEKNYVTIEDPVEYYMDMAGQVLIREKIGLDFASVLRAILRQDPDVILLGEIRDFETAEVAFHAALTGHMVYSTLHTNSTIDSIVRLTDLGLKPYIIAAAIGAVIAQRLVRKICPICREEIQIERQELHKLGPLFVNKTLNTYQGKGCMECHQSGYKGRAGIYEILVPDEKIRSFIAREASSEELLSMAKEQGLSTLIEDARNKVHEGLTTVDEVLRVLGPQVVI